MEKVIEYSNATELKNFSSIFSEIEDSYLYCNIADGAPLHEFEKNPLKLNGTMLVLFKDCPEFNVEVNLTSYSLKPGALLMGFPGNVLYFRDKIPANVDATALFFNMSFLQNVNINMSSIVIPPMIQRPESVGYLSEEEAALIEKYFELLHLNTKDNTNHQINKNIATSIIAAMFYQLVQFFHKRMLSEAVPKPKGALPSGRRHDYVRDFVRLVHLNFIKERSVAFYADKLFISPKYLSLLVKEATGRSASQWIDDFVVTEAKNMLRFSGKNIQQVAYALNFPTQSSFGKYFKHLTGMSPTEFQKS